MKRKYRVFSSKYLVLGLVLFLGACNSSEESKPKFPIIITDHYCNKGQLREPKDPYYHDFRILYIGERSDTINNISPFGISTAILQLPGKEKKIKKQRDYVMNLRSYDIYSNQKADFTIEVDTAQVISLLNYNIDDEFPIGLFYPVIISNKSLTDSLFFPIYRSHSISLAVDYNNKNYSIGSILGCGTHRECVYIPPQKIMITAVQKTKGSKRLKTFVQYDTVKSNEFYLELNPEIFNSKMLPSF